MKLEKIYMTIFNFILEILVHNCDIFYEELGEDFVEKFEFNYRNKFRSIVFNKIREGKLSELLNGYFNLEYDEYGLQNNESYFKYQIDEVCRELCNELDVETRIMRSEMEEFELIKLQNEKKQLSENMNSLQEKNRELSIDIDNLKQKNEELNENLSKKSDSYILDLKKDIRNLKKEIDDKIDIINGKEKNIQHLKGLINSYKNKKEEDIQDYEDKINIFNEKNYELKIKHKKEIEESINEINKLKNEISELKIKYEKEIKENINEINKLNSEIKERKALSDKSSNFIKENNKLKNEISELKIKIEKIKQENEGNKQLDRDILKSIIKNYKEIYSNIIEQINNNILHKKVIKGIEDYEEINIKFMERRDDINLLRANLRHEKPNYIQKSLNEDISDVISLIEKIIKIHKINNLENMFDDEIKEIQQIQNKLRGE